MYQRKTKDWYNLMIDYGYGHGFEYVSCCETRKEAILEKKSYIVNAGNTFNDIKISKKRETIIKKEVK